MKKIAYVIGGSGLIGNEVIKLLLKIDLLVNLTSYSGLISGFSVVATVVKYLSGLFL